VQRALQPVTREAAAEASELVAEVRDGVERIARLVSNLRVFARQDDGSRRGPVSLHEVARRAAVVAGVGEASGVIRQIFHEAPTVEANESELVQVVLNLLVNAIQAGGSGSPIEIHVGSERDGAFLRVRDHGPGIAPDALPHLFDPFFTTKAPGEGTGLGLSLSFDLVRKHGGNLEGRNCRGGGACFEMWLPARSGQEASAGTGGSCPGAPAVCGVVAPERAELP
jgi:signal transduction histidine kinase